MWSWFLGWCGMRSGIFDLRRNLFSGLFYISDGSRAKALDYHDKIFQKMKIIQAMTTLIDPGCSVWDEYGIQRSGRHFFTTWWIDMKVNKHNIELQCHWSTERANGVRFVQWSMIHNYSEVRNMQQALICPSKACWRGPVFWTQSSQTQQTMGSGIILETRWGGGVFPFLLEGILPIFWGGIVQNHL